MRGLRWLGPVLLVVGIAALAVGMAQGQATLNLFLIFPVITATGGWSALGILLLIAGFFALVLTWPAYALERMETAEAPSVPAAPSTSSPATPARRWGGVLFLGPFPVVFGSDARIAKWMLVAGFMLFAALVVLTVIVLWGI